MNDDIDAGGDLLAAHEPNPVGRLREQGASPFLLTCDHACNRVPQALGSLGLAHADLERHIGYDIGALGVAQALSALLDAPLIWQNYSRLVIDCNRQPTSADSIPAVSETTEVPGNRELSDARIDQRRQAVFWPYQRAIAATLDRRAAAGRPAVMVCMHSYTPVYKGVSRAWDMSLMYNARPELAQAIGAVAADDPDWRRLTVGINEPYIVDPVNDYGVPVHGDRRGLYSVLIEVRQDLIVGADSQRVWSQRLAGWLSRALPRLTL